jgi:hypothetical protein
MDKRSLKKSSKRHFKIQKYFVASLLLIAVLGGGAYFFSQIQSRFAKASVASLGSASSINGDINTVLPPITLTGVNIDLTNPIQASFQAEGCTVPITGFITQAQSVITWHADNAATIPTCALAGSRIGVLQSGSSLVVNVSTNFSLPQDTAQITDIETDNSNYIINFNKGVFNQGNKLNFYFTQADPNYTLQDPNNLPSNQQVTTGSPTTISISATPALAKKICVLVQATTGSVIPQSGNCLDIPYPINNGFRTGRLYFVGMDNATPNLDANSEFNTSYLQTQKYKDGTINLVYDEITDPTGTNVITGTCTFKLYKYGNSAIPANVLKTYTSSLSNGVCQAAFPASDQTINYYRVRVEVTNGNNLMYNTDTLVLPVGGSSTSGGGPDIQL